jgi:hypothetical protein
VTPETEREGQETLSGDLGDQTTTSDPEATYRGNAYSINYQGAMSEPRAEPLEFSSSPPPPPPPPPDPLHLLPPPPPQPPRDSSYGLSPGFTTSADVSNQSPETLAERLAREQEELQDFRDEVLGTRFRVAAKRRKLRDLHIETGVKDGIVFNLLRQYLQTNNTHLPQHIEEALNDASLLRDQLGLLEAEYDEAEASYNTLEWKYSWKEGGFFERVRVHELVPGVSLDRHRGAENLEIAELTRFAIGPDVASSDITNCRMDIPISIDLQDQPRVPISENALARFNHTFPPEVDTNNTHSAWSESNASTLHARLDWFKKVERIEEWILGMVDVSRLQKIHLRASCQKNSLEGDSWWEQTKDVWSLDRSGPPAFHTGDSSVSQRDNRSSRGVSLSTIDIPASRMGTAKTETPIAVLPEDQTLQPSRSAIILDSTDVGHLSESGHQMESPRGPPLSTINESGNVIVTSPSPSRRTSATEPTATHNTSHDSDSKNDR